MLFDCLKLKKNTENKNPQVGKTKNKNDAVVKLCGLW